MMLVLQTSKRVLHINGELYANGVMAVHIDVTAILVYYCSSKAAFSLNGIGINGSTEI